MPWLAATREGLDDDHAAAAARAWLGQHASIVELDMVEGKTDGLSDAEIWGGDLVPPPSTSRFCLLHWV